MEREFRLPDLGSGLKEGRLVAWRVAVGDEVTTDDVLCELETEKAVIEIPVPFEGVVVSLAVGEDEDIAVGDVLAVIQTAGGPAIPDQEQEAPAAAEEVIVSGAPAGSEGPVAPTDRVRAAPVARRIAREHGIDLTAIAGTGSGGRITRGDVEVAVARAQAGVAPTAPTPSTHSADSAGGARREPLSMLRKSIAGHMERSWREIPHVFTRIEVDASRFLEARAALSEQLGAKIPIEAMLIKAALPALREFPHFNAAFAEDAITLFERYDIGVAVDTAEGLIVPVLKGADGLNLAELVNRLTDLVARTIERKAAPDELTGGTFTVNNIGALGHLIGTSIIPHGTTAILSAGRARRMPVADGDEIVIRPVMEVTLSFDHRAIDGGLAQRFMQRIRENLEQPVRYLAG